MSKYENLTNQEIIKDIKSIVDYASQKEFDETPNLCDFFISEGYNCDLKPLWKIIDSTNGEEVNWSSTFKVSLEKHHNWTITINGICYLEEGENKYYGFSWEEDDVSIN